ncbi:MAG: putative porin [Rikenellaceae bacterium]
MRRELTNLLRGCLSLVILLIFLIGSGSAQSTTDEVYSGNPFQIEENEEGNDGGDGTTPPPGAKGEKADSVEEKKIKAPLESYFFSDSLRALPNISWTLNRDYNEIEFSPLDTTLVDWRIDFPIYREGLGDMTLGGLGQASQPLEYSQRSNDFNFSFAQPYNGYIYNMENVPFYNTKTIYSQMNYLEAGQKTYRETNFAIRHAQNISPTTGFNIAYKSPGTRGQYMRQDTKNHNFEFAASHTGKRYTVHAGYINNKIEVEESGGVVGEWAIVDSIFEMSIGVPMKLENAEAMNTYRNNSFFVQQSYGVPLERMGEYDFSMADLSAVYFGHSFEYNKWTRKYTDVYATYTDALNYRDENGDYVSVDGLEYYENWFIDPEETRDSISERVISNRFYIQAQPWGRYGMLGTLNAGVGLDFHSYSHFEMNNYLSGELSKNNKTSWFVYGKIDGRLREYVNWGAHLKLYPSGYRGGDMEAGADIALGANIANKLWVLKGEVELTRQSPSYWEQNLFSNHFVWNNNFDTESETRIKVSLAVPDCNFDLGVTQSVATNKIYYNAESIVSQESAAVSVTGIYARKDFKVGGFNFGHRVLWQLSSDEEVVAVPEWGAYLSYYYEFWVVKDVLRLQLGVDGRYTSKYYMPGYNPALSTFYNQREWESGGYPYMDAYAAAKWKRMRILVKYQHLNEGLFGNNEYFSVAGYPLNPGMLKFGISWSFYD